MENKPKFTLNDITYNPINIAIKHDVRIDGELHRDYPVSHVTIRCVNDPVYINKVMPIQADIHEKYLQKVKELKALAEESGEDVSDEEVERQSLEIYKDMSVKVIAYAIEDWDEEFFGSEFSTEAAVELFKQDRMNYIYNQIANAYKERQDFLPNVST